MNRLWIGVQPALLDLAFRSRLQCDGEALVGPVNADVGGVDGLERYFNVRIGPVLLYLSDVGGLRWPDFCENPMGWVLIGWVLGRNLI